MLTPHPDFEKTCSGAPLVSQFHLGSEGFTQLFRDGDNAWTKSSVLVVVVDLYEDGRRVVQNENGLGTFLLPSSVVGRMQLNVLHDSGGVNRGLPPANSDCATDRHLPAHEKHRRQASRCIHVMKWITCYMALSRVRSLSTLRSVGLTSDIRDLLDLGPPDGFYTRFLKVFGDKISNTQKEVEAVLAELGWND